MFHEVLYQSTKVELTKTLEVLSRNLLTIQSLDPENYRDLVEQKIELIL